MQDNYNPIYSELLNELKRRVAITTKTRIFAADRLRNKDSQYKKLNMYYSVLITTLSIFSINSTAKIDNMSISNIVLTASVILSYFMFYVSEKNLQERAYRMEENYKNLDKLNNKINSIINANKYICIKLYKEYEQLLASIENHESIDFKMYQLDQYNKNKKPIDKNFEIIRKEVKLHNRILLAKTICAYVLPGIGAFIILIKLFITE